MHKPAKGFSLLEVVVAVGVFALGIIVVIGLFAPLARSVATNADAEAATNIAEAIKAELTQRVRQSHSFEPVTALLQGGDTGVFSRAKLLFANRAGTKIGEDHASIWTGASGEKFFEIGLMRNAALSPGDDDVSAIVLVYTARIRWPAFAAGESDVLPADGHNASVGQQTLLINGSIRR